MPITIKIDGADTLRATLPEIPKTMERIVIARMSEIAFDAMEKGASRHRVTGALLQSLYNREVPGGRQVWHDPQRAPHAAFVVFGTKDHSVAPVNKKALRWVGPSGKFFFSKGHKVRGIVEDRYDETAADEAIKAFGKIVDDALKEATP